MTKAGNIKPLKELQKEKSSKRLSSQGKQEQSGMQDEPHTILMKKEKGKQLASQKKPVAGMSGCKKQYSQSHSSCMVTFRLPKDAVGSAKKVTLVGDFNAWDQEGSPMKRLRSGAFEITLELPAERAYRYRFLIDGNHWENDWYADKYVPNPYGCDDSVIVL